MAFGNLYRLQGGMRIIAKAGDGVKQGAQSIRGAEIQGRRGIQKNYFRCACTQHPSSSSSGTFCPKAKRDDRRNSQRKEIKNPTKRRDFTGKDGILREKAGNIGKTMKLRLHNMQ